MRRWLTLALLLFATSATGQTISAIPGTLYILTTTHPVSITVSGGPAHPRDYVAIYVAGASTYMDWLYTNGTKTRGTGSPGGTVRFVLRKSGKYEARFYSLTDAGVAKLLATKAFDVDPLTELELIDFTGIKMARKPDNDLDQITVEQVGTAATATTPKDTKITLNGKVVP